MALYEERRALIFELVRTLTRRARLLQWGQALFCLAVAMFVSTNIGIGLAALAWTRYAWINVVLSLARGDMLLVASVFLIVESRLGLHMTQVELQFLNRPGDPYASQSSRSATSGSTRIARRAGT